MVSLERCRELAKKHGYNYTDDELLKIRDFLYQLAEIECNIYQREKDEREKSDNLYEGVIRRAS
jgi:hypothetical protein